MIFKKDNFIFGLILGFLAPLIVLLFFKFTKFESYSFNEVFEFLLNESGFRTLSALLSISLLGNAILFTVYINNRIDKTAKGIFVTTLLYGLVILLIKTFY
jgi:hypothetical protein